ncbi:hypothetical protein B5G50_29145 [Brevibacillus brevis]|uniref:hypothetical protein n=1 Tax=Brevibacillus brevis TaxID=1393 RepID=UPI000B376084|nr:hypothetical protein [Brevibacillus brevis]OUQ85032.1 hypothetical protein B5G50_29145 [Brevibacillus brevis]
MLLSKKVKMAALTSLSVVALVMPLNATAQGEKKQSQEVSSENEKVQPMMTDKFLWSREVDVGSYYRIPKTITLSYKERGIKVEADVTATGISDYYDVSIEQFSEALEGWTPVETREFEAGRDRAYFSDLEQTVDYRISIKGSVEGTIYAYKVVD